MKESKPDTTTQPTPRRIFSIDALRGFDMFMLSGGAAIILALSTWWTDGAPPEGLVRQLTHAEFGEGFTAWDLVMPLFIFIVGASMPFAFEKYRQKGGTWWRLRTTWRVLRRVALLFILGMVVQGNLCSAELKHMSLFCNTLHAIAEGYLIAAIVLMCGGIRTQIIACVALMAAYWALMRFMPYDGNPGGLFLKDNNLAIYIDHQLQGELQDGTPYSWILTSLSFGALTLMGVLGGQIIRTAKRHRHSLSIMGAATVGCLIGGMLLSYDTPINKHLFTTSMVLWSGGWCYGLLLLFHLAFDCTQKLHAVAFPLRVIGSNAMLVYLLAETPGLRGSIWNTLCTPLFGPYAATFEAHTATLVYQLLCYLLLWLFMYFLYRHKALLRV